MSMAELSNSLDGGACKLKICIWCKNKKEHHKFCSGKSFCRECKSKYDKEYRIRNLEKKKAYDKNWRANPENKEKRRISNKAWMERNPEKQLSATRNWQKNNLPQYREYAARYRAENKKECAARKSRWTKTARGMESIINCTHKRRALVKSSKNVPTNEKMKELRMRAKGVCHYCRNKVKMLTFDHIIPLSKGGAHEIGNLVMACGSCNSKKGAKHPEKFACEIGMLLI